MKHSLLGILALGSVVTMASAAPSGGAGTGDGCSVQLFDRDDLDETDNHVTIADPARFADLRNLKLEALRL